VRVLVACESSGVVRDAFLNQGHDAFSCDILPADHSPERHIQGDVAQVLKDDWDLLIAHPPCTYLCSSGMHWTVRGLRDPQLTEDALNFVRLLMDAPVERICIENPVGAIGSRIRKADQYIQPYEFGEDASKRTGLWLKGLPPLIPTNIVDGREARIHKMAPGPDRWKQRSLTYEGIAEAMADQWGSIAKEEEYA